MALKQLKLSHASAGMSEYEGCLPAWEVPDSQARLLGLTGKTRQSQTEVRSKHLHNATPAEGLEGSRPDTGPLLCP